MMSGAMIHPELERIVSGYELDDRDALMERCAELSAWWARHLPVTHEEHKLIMAVVERPHELGELGPMRKRN